MSMTDFSIMSVNLFCMVNKSSCFLNTLDFQHIIIAYRMRIAFSALYLL